MRSHKHPTHPSLSAAKFTYKFFGAGEVKELDETKVIACHQVDAGVGNTSTVHIRLFSVTRPDPENLVPQDAGKKNTDQYLRDSTASLVLLRNRRDVPDVNWSLTCSWKCVKMMRFLKRERNKHKNTDLSTAEYIYTYVYICIYTSCPASCCSTGSAPRLDVPHMFLLLWTSRTRQPAAASQTLSTELMSETISSSVRPTVCSLLLTLCSSRSTDVPLVLHLISKVNFRSSTFSPLILKFVRLWRSLFNANTVLMSENHRTTLSSAASPHIIVCGPASPGPGCPGDPLDDGLLRYHLPWGNFMHLPGVGAGGHLEQNRKTFSCYINITLSHEENGQRSP